MVRALAHVRQTRDTTRGLWEIGNLIDGWVLGYTDILIIFPEVVASITTVSATVEPPARVAIRLRRFSTPIAGESLEGTMGADVLPGI